MRAGVRAELLYILKHVDELGVDASYLRQRERSSGGVDWVHILWWGVPMGELQRNDCGGVWKCVLRGYKVEEDASERPERERIVRRESCFY